MRKALEAIKSGITDKYHLFVVCENIEGAYRLIQGAGIKELNLGGTTPGEDKRSLAPAVYVNQKEEEMLKELIEPHGVHVYQQDRDGKGRADDTSLEYEKEEQL